MKYILTFLLSTFFLALTYSSAPGEFSTFDLVFIVFLLSMIVSFETSIAHLFVRFPIAQNLILAGSATINILYVNLVLNDAYITLPKYAQTLALLVSVFIVFTFMNILDERTSISKVLTSLFAVAIAVVLAQTIFPGPSVSIVPAAPGKTSAKNIRIVDFKTKPNVYFVSFDSMIPKALLKKHLQLETTAYHEVLDVHFRPFVNFFADRPLTKSSLNSLLALDLEHFSEAARNDIEHYFFPGLAPSPLLELFKHNGYETTTLFRSAYFGQKKGPYVDNYRRPNSFFNNDLCEFIDSQGWRALTLMGYCSFKNSVKVRSALKWLGVIDDKKEIEFLLEHMRIGLQKGVPQMFLAYIFSPGHTKSGTFDRKADGMLETYKQQYFEASKKTAKQLNEIIHFVANEDPKAIVFAFGDHGPWISRQETFEEDSIFFVQDRYGVYGGIHPPNRCADSLSKTYNKDFVTILQAAHMIIRCLSGGMNAFITLDNYRLPESETEARNRYEDYLYE